MKKIVLLVLLMVGILNAWEFTKEDLHDLSVKQKETLLLAKEIGYMYGLGDALVHIAGVETRFGKYRNSKKTHCGPMQISTYHAGVTCKVLRDNIYLSMVLAAQNLKYWLSVYDNDMDKALIGYNGGYDDNPHGSEYLERIEKVKVAMKEVQKEIRIT